MEKETQREIFIQHRGGIQNNHFVEKAKFNDSSAIMQTETIATVALCKPCTTLMTQI